MAQPGAEQHLCSVRLAHSAIGAEPGAMRRVLGDSSLAERAPWLERSLVLNSSKHTSNSSHLRYITSYLQPNVLSHAISQALKQASLELPDIAWFGCIGADKKTIMRLSSVLSVSPAKFFNDRIEIPQGTADSADVLIFLKHFIDTAKPDEWGLLTCVGNGADVLIVQKVAS